MNHKNLKVKDAIRVSLSLHKNMHSDFNIICLQTSANMEFACEHYPTLEKCESSLNPAAMKLLKDVMAISDAEALKARHEFKSEITTAVELMEFLDL